MGPVFLAGLVDGLKTLGINLPSLLAQLINFTLLLILLNMKFHQKVIHLLISPEQEMTNIMNKHLLCQVRKIFIFMLLVS